MTRIHVYAALVVAAAIGVAVKQAHGPAGSQWAASTSADDTAAQRAPEAASSVGPQPRTPAPSPLGGSVVLDSTRRVPTAPALRGESLLGAGDGMRARADGSRRAALLEAERDAASPRERTARLLECARALARASGGADAPDANLDRCSATPHELVLPGELVVRGIHEHSADLPDSLGEWFEIENQSAHSIELMGLEVRDDGVDAFRVRHSLVLPPGERAVFARNGDPRTNGGLRVDYVYSDFILSAFGDAIELRSEGITLDRRILEPSLAGPQQASTTP